MAVEGFGEHLIRRCGVRRGPSGYAVFTTKAKPVFNAEHASTWATDAAARAQPCASARAAGLRTLVLAEALDDSLRFSCD